MADAKKKPKYVIVKQEKFATAGGGLGLKPKVYNTMKAAQYDIDSKPKLKGGVVRPYGGTDATGAAPGTPVTTTSAKAATTAKAATPKRASAGK